MLNDAATSPVTETASALAPKRSRFHRHHGPTWLVALAIYGGWVTLTLLHARIPFPLLVLLGGTILAWHGSLQHETIHGHPGGPRWVATLLGAPPLSLWLPYGIYRDTHRRHHATQKLTDPVHDPEPPTQQSALARLTLGPFTMIGAFVASEITELVRGTSTHRRAWALHLLTVSLVVLWLVAVAHMPLWKYAVAFVYPGTSLTLLRSLAEHRVDVVPERRTTVVEAGLFFRLVFLNNNFHVAHHASPRAPWFELPALWSAERASLLARSPELVHPGYLSIVRRRLLTPVDPT